MFNPRFTPMSSFFIIAHRGGKGPCTENTLEAFQYGLEHGANAVEMDVRFDRSSKHFYLEHDFIHSPKKRKNTIDKIIPFLPAETSFFIELKTLTLFGKFSRHFLDVIRKYDLLSRAVVISFNPFVLYQLRKLKPDIQIGFLCASETWGWLFRKWVCKLLRPQFLLLNRKMLNKKMVRFGNEMKLKIISFTSNNEEAWLKAKALALNGVITDYPQEVRDLVG